MNINRPTDAPPPARSPAPTRNANLSQRSRQDDFERALRDKSATRDEPEPETGSDETAAKPEPTEPLAALLAGLAAVKLPVHEQPVAAAGATAQQAEGGTRAAVQTALNAQVPPVVALGASAASAWEVRLREPLSVPLDLKAAKAESTPGWSLTVSSPTGNEALLARHAHRLNERLQAHATHARITGTDTDPQGGRG